SVINSGSPIVCSRLPATRDAKVSPGRQYGNAAPQGIFSHVADGPPQWQTGLALLNGTTTPANVEMYALNPSGSLIGKTTLTIDPQKKIATIIHDLIPETRGMNGGFIYVRSTN